MMWVYIDDSGDGGLKFETGSTSHLVMAACIFREPLEIAKLARRIHECSDKNRHASEFKYSKTKDRGRNQAVDAPRLNSSLSISRGVAPPRICRGVSLSSFCTHATCSGVTVAKSVPFL